MYPAYKLLFGRFWLFSLPFLTSDGFHLSVNLSHAIFCLLKVYFQLWILEMKNQWCLHYTAIFWPDKVANTVIMDIYVWRPICKSNSKKRIHGSPERCCPAIHCLRIPAAESGDQQGLRWGKRLPSPWHLAHLVTSKRHGQQMARKNRKGNIDI